jgi:hypothetical protein
MAWRLFDLSTGVIDRATNVVTRPCDSWPVATVTEFLEILARIKRDALIDHRVLRLESDELSATFGVGGGFSYVQAGHRHPPYEGKSYFRSLREGEELFGRDIGFRLWSDDLFEFSIQELIPWDQAQEILVWIFRHEALPEWDEERGCPPFRGDSRGDQDDIPF